MYELLNVQERDQSQICAVGFEPNQEFETQLKEVERQYRKCGWNVWIQTKTGVTAGTDGEEMRFMRVKSSSMAGHLVSANDGNLTEKVNSVRIAAFINDLVATRKLPEEMPGGKKPSVLMKLDVEGAEVGIVPDLILSGALTHVDRVMVEYHTNHPKLKLGPETREKIKKLKNATKLIQSLAMEHGLENSVGRFSSLDDESFSSFQGDFPAC